MGNIRRILPITAMATHLTPPVTEAPLGPHAISQREPVSAFHGKGKKSSMHLIEHVQFNDMLRGLGNTCAVDMESFSIIEKFVCALYKADDACYELFCSNSPVERQLPPNHACLLQHIKRGTYQTKIWKLATTAMMNCPSPAGHGWTVSQELLSVNWMEGDAVLDSVLQTLFCSCKVLLCTSGKCFRVLPNNWNVPICVGACQDARI